MKIAMLGATGAAGSRIRDEALRRGHEVTAIARHPEALPPRDRLVARAGDALDTAAIAPLLAGHDAVISAMRFVAVGAAPIIDAVRRAGVSRLLVVGGAGSLEVAPGKLMVDTPGTPPQAQAEARAGCVFLETLRAERTLAWTFLSPSGMFAPGKRTGTFRLGTDQLLTSPSGPPGISMEDFAIAMIDELERPRHVRQRFTVGY